MNINSLTIITMREEHIREIARWRYDGVYAFYNRPEIPEDEPVEIPENSYAVYDGEEMIGHFYLGEDGQIPTVENYAYTPDYMDIALVCALTCADKESGKIM